MRAANARLVGGLQFRAGVVTTAQPWGSSRREHFVRPGRYTYTIILSPAFTLHVEFSDFLADHVGLGEKLLPNFIFAGAGWND